MSPFIDKKEKQPAFCRNKDRALREIGIAILGRAFPRKSILLPPQHSKARMVNVLSADFL